MVVQRVDGSGAGLATSSFELWVSESYGSESNNLLVCTLMTLSSPMGFPPSTLDSWKFKGQGWKGDLFWFDTALMIPGPVFPLVLVKPKVITETIRNRCVHLDVGTGLDPIVKVPPEFRPRWSAGGPATEGHPYSLDITRTIDGGHAATYLPGMAGARPTSDDEGQIADFGSGNALDRYGIIVDVDPGVPSQAVPLRTLLNDLRLMGALS